MPPKPTASPLKDPKKRKLLIYGGLAAAMLVMYLLSRSSSSSGSSSSSQTAAQQQAAAQAAQQQAALDAANYGSGSYGSGAGGIDPSTDMANIDSDLQTLSQQFASYQNAATTPGSGSTATAPAGTTIGTYNEISGGTAYTGTVYQQAAPAGPGGGAATTATQPAVAPTRMSVLTAAQKSAGYIAAPFGAKNPGGAPAGYQVVGLGSGNWGYKPIPKPTAPAKTQPKSSKK